MLLSARQEDELSYDYKSDKEALELLYFKVITISKYNKI